MQTVCTSEKTNLDELITTYFHDKKYRLFREFCFKYQITTLAEIDQDVLVRFSKQLGVGRTKASRIQAIFDNDFPVQVNQAERAVQPIEAALPTTLTIEQIQRINIGIQEAFSETHFKMIVNFCRANEVLLVSDLTVATLRKIRMLSGMGPKKYRYLFERLESLYEQLSEARFEIENEILAQVSHHHIDELIGKFGLTNHELFPKMTVAELQGRAVKEIVELEKSHSIILLNRYLTSPKTTITTALNQLNEYEQKILLMQSKDEESLLKISLEFHLTPDRILQIEKRIQNRLWAEFEQCQLLQLLAILDNSEHHVSETYLNTHLPEYKQLVMNIIENN